MSNINQGEEKLDVLLVAYLEQHGLLPSLKSAYRIHLSTEMAVLRVISDVLLAADRKDVTLLGLLDLSAALDMIDDKILINRLQTSFGNSWESAGMDITHVRFIWNSQQNQQLFVACHKAPLGPVLFLLYTADVVVGIARHRHGITQHSYADDKQPFPSIHQLRHVSRSIHARTTAKIDELKRWMWSNRVKLNTENLYDSAADSKSRRHRCDRP